MAHVDPDSLADLVLDPASVAAQVHEHVQGCPECAEVVTSLADVRRAVGAEPLVAPPAGLRDRVLAEALAGGSRPGTARPGAARPGAARPGAAATPQRDTVVPIGRRSAVPLWLASAAAVLALVAGLGVGRWTADDPVAAPDPAPTPAVVASAALTSLDSDAPRGDVEAFDSSDDVVSVSVRARELGGEPGYHEVWLINVDGKRMVALGILARGDDGTFEVPRRLLDEGYRILDISVEPDDGDPSHSGVSLARGQLA